MFNVRPDNRPPGFRLNADGSIRQEPLRASPTYLSLARSPYDGLDPSPVDASSRLANDVAIAGLTQPPLAPRTDQEPGVSVIPMERPPPSMPQNLLGLPPELMRDPSSFYLDVPGQVPPRIEYWPRRRWIR